MGTDETDGGWGSEVGEGYTLEYGICPYHPFIAVEEDCAVAIALSCFSFALVALLAQSPVPSALPVPPGVPDNSGVSPLEVSWTPEQLTIASVRPNQERRVVLLQSNRPITNLSLTALDLPQVGGGAIFPANGIQIELSQPPNPNANVRSIAVTADLGQAQQSGEFSGALLLSVEGRSRRIPLTLRIKSPPGLPLLILLLGVGLGFWLSNYRRAGLVRDELIVQINGLRQQMQAETALVDRFRDRIESYLVDAETALSEQEWSAAERSLEAAQTVWQRWLRGRADWLIQLKYKADKLDPGVRQLDLTQPYGAIVQRNLEKTVQEIAEQESPYQFHEQLVEIQQQINRYITGKQQIDQLNELANQLPKERRTLWQFKIQEFEDELNGLRPNEQMAEADYRAWYATVKKAISRLTQEVQAAARSTQGSLSTTLRQIIQFPLLNPVTDVPQVGAIANPKSARSATFRLRLFGWVSLAVAIAVLTLTGFNQLYVAQPTFGANVLSDYFALFAWGFGTEVTSESIAKVLREWSAD
jgi:hypothetical protein